MSLSHVVVEFEKDHAIAVLKTSNIMNFCQESASLIKDEVVVNWTASEKHARRNTRLLCCVTVVSSLVLNVVDVLPISYNMPFKSN